MAARTERHLHESTSRMFCRLAFLLLGLLPLACCLLFCGVQWLPQYRQWQVNRWEQRLSTTTGFLVRIAEVTEATPTQAKLCGVRLLHPESQVSFARADTVEVALYRDQWLVHVDQAELEGRKLGEHWQLLHESLLCRPRSSARTAHVKLSELNVHTRAGKQSLRELSVKLSPSTEKTCLWIDFQLNPAGPGATADRQVDSTPIRVSLVRSHQRDERITEGQLRAEQGSLPLRLVEVLWDEAEHLGAEATLSGVVNWRISPHQWTVSIPSSGLLFERVDFAKLTWNAPSEITGLGVVRLTDTWINQAGIQQLRGVARIGLGRASKRLLLAAETYMGLQIAPETRAQATREIPFEDACFGFEISPAFLKLAGLLEVGGKQTNGVFLDSNGIFASIPYTTLSLGRLVKAMDRSAHHTEQVPSGLLARRLLQWLPLEQNQVERTAEEKSMRLTVQ